MSDKCTGTGGVLKVIKKDIELAVQRDAALADQIEALRAMGLGGTYKGVHQLATAYAADDIVSRDGVLYSSNADNNTTVPPSVSWTQMIQSDYGYYTGGA